MSNSVIRAAEPNDATDIAAIHVRTWQVAYRDLMPQEFLDGLDAGRRTEGWRRSLTQPRPRESTLVAVADGQVVGFANIGPSRDPGAADDEGELRAIYVDPDRWGSGVGRELMTSAIRALGGAGFDRAILWVLIGNERARRFYEAGGWTSDTTTKQEDSFGVQVTEVRYRRALP